MAETTAGMTRSAQLRFGALAFFVGAMAVFGAVSAGGLGLKDVQTVRDWAQASGSWAPLFWVGILACRPFLFLPAAPTMMAGGIMFGTWNGAVLTTFGMTLGAVTTYGLARWLGRDFVRARLGPAVDEFAETELGPGLVLLSNLLPFIPLSLPNYGGGLIGMPLGVFIAATATGLAPRVLAWSTMGQTLIELDKVGVAVSILFLGVLMLVPLAIPSVRRSLRVLAAKRRRPAADVIDREPA